MDFEQVYRAVGANVKRRRIMKNISQQELAYRLEIDKSNLIRIEKGRTNPTLKTLLKISLALDISICELVKPLADEF